MVVIIEVISSFGKVIADPMKLVDIHNVQPMADDESINNSTVTATNQDAEVAVESCCDLANASAVDADLKQ